MMDAVAVAVTTALSHGLAKSGVALRLPPQSKVLKVKRVNLSVVLAAFIR